MRERRLVIVAQATSGWVTLLALKDSPPWDQRTLLSACSSFAALFDRSDGERDGHLMELAFMTNTAVMLAVNLLCFWGARDADADVPWQATRALLTACIAALLCRNLLF